MAKMPLVTEDFFTAFERIFIWRSLFMFGCAFVGTSLIMLPILMRAPRIPMFMWAFWVLGVACISVGAWRWIHWRRIQKRSIVG
jgi:hypothetical protein